ncbi:CDA_G0054610.mRNA.1.CDS.1 [Saccharomyces cerevisiae]|nr:CDA_G0054610.mRNA.1.CDS.1 [Saccharomyces cerevisiae]CAI7479705.1 CDA_G0054610.mRNA.1.CDS.1 [Saccharomyces cerevisiae]
MGRRKIEIQRISDDRNRAVTFIKRKAGLFKKAHELSVLCQVDIAVIILGSNNTFYEFSSVDTNDLIYHYQNDKNLLHEVKDPSDYGDFHKSASVNINQDLLRSSIEQNKRHPENALPPLQHLKRLKPDPLQISRTPQQQQQQNISRPYHSSMYNLNQPSSSSSSPSTMDFPKLPSFQNSSFNGRPPPISISPNKFSKPFTNASSRTPKQEHKINNSGSNNNDNSNYTQSPPNSLEDSIQQTVKARRKLSARPVLRVRIPNNNFSSNSAIPSEPSSASSTSANGNSMGSSQIMKENKTSRSSKISPLSASASGPLTLQKGNNGRVVIKLPNANAPNGSNNGNGSNNNNHPYPFGSGSSPLFSATQPYIATPLQPSNIPGGPFQQNTSFLAQRQTQQYQQMSFKKQSQTVPLTTTLTGRPPSTFSGPETSNGPPTGSLPSKFVHDLMSNSPNVSSISITYDAAATAYNGNTGLTPYINTAQTPLGTKFFNFSTDISGEKNSSKI